MNKTELQEARINRKNEAQYKENITNLRKEINEIKNIAHRTTLPLEPLPSKNKWQNKSSIPDKNLWNSDFLITPMAESSRMQLSKKLKKRESK